MSGMKSTPSKFRSVTLDYDLLATQIDGLLSVESDFIANAANFSAALYLHIPRINWAGFYFPSDDGLVLGPFVGQPGCTRLPHGKGVCGAAVLAKRSILVEDVEAFVDHIACDSASRSELVVPLLLDEVVCGVFDLDSPELARFTVEDRVGVERLVAVFLERTALPARLRRGRTSLRDEASSALCDCRLQHAQIAGMLDRFDVVHASPEQASAFIARLRPILLSHLRYEEHRLFPRIERSGKVMQKRMQRVASEVLDTTEHAVQFFDTWQSSFAIHADRARFVDEWRVLERAIRARMRTEEEDLFLAVETGISQ